MALILTGLIWVTYAVAIAILISISAIFVYVYQKPRDRAASVTAVCIVTVSALLATTLLLPVDVALVSATVRSSDGVRKDWATQDEVDKIVRTLTIVYYTLYSLDALLCLVIVPFTYFLYEEYDEQEVEVGGRTLGSRVWIALEYTFIFIVLVIVLFLVGFFIPAVKYDETKHRGLEFFKELLSENNGERALSFALGSLITLGSILYAVYTAAGLALLPIRLIKSAPAISRADLAAITASELAENQERQRQLERRNEGRQRGLDARERRELEQLTREERALVRRERLAAENSGQDQSRLVRAWSKISAFFRPVKLIGGVLLILISMGIWVSMLITGIDKVKNSVCKIHCGYLLGHVNIFQPANSILVHASKVFPIDYIVFALLVFFMFSSSVVGIATIGIRFLWLTIFNIRKGHTSPQAMLMATVLLTLIVLAIDYSVMMIIAPQYATFGPQTYCDRPVKNPTEQPDCSNHQDLIRSCTETAQNPVARNICTPSVASTFINRSTINYPSLGAIDFWVQFVFLGIYFMVAVLALFRTPKLDMETLDEDLEEEEEESLIHTTGRRFNAAFNDLLGRSRRRNPGDANYGTTDS